MVDRTVVAEDQSSDSSWSRRNRIVAVISVATSLVAVASFLWFAFVNTSFYPHVRPYAGRSDYPVGVIDKSEPSGKAPPGPEALKGYSLSYVTNFPGTTLPAGWDVFTGVPGGDPGGQFGSAHVVVRNGMLQLSTWKDPTYKDKWVTGGVCQCGLSQTYGAYFVRSRVTSPGPNEVELLWPTSNVWPPEIDFNETATAFGTTSTVHFGETDEVDQRQLSINMKQWHTWGVIWTPRSITFVVNGQVWGTISVASEIANVPMTLDIEQRAMCQLHRQCPTKRTSMLVNWVAEYVPKSS